MATSERQTINFLNPLGPPSDAWTAIYNWVLRVGRYLLVTVEIVVLVVFFARFIYDRINNDLTEEINDKVEILSDQTLRSEEIRYRNLHLLFADITDLDAKQPTNSSEVATVISGVPTAITLDKFAFTTNRISLTLLGSDFETIKDYEFSLRQNPRYEDISLTVSKSGQSTSEIEVTVSFVILSEEEGNG